MLLLKTANCFDGINPEATRAYYKSHISKNIGIAVAGIDFEDSLVNGGRANKFFSQYPKVPKLDREIL